MPKQPPNSRDGSSHSRKDIGKLITSRAEGRRFYLRNQRLSASRMGLGVRHFFEKHKHEGHKVHQGRILDDFAPFPPFVTFVYFVFKKISPYTKEGSLTILRPSPLCDLRVLCV